VTNVHVEACVTSNGSYYVPRERIYSFLNPASMNNEEGLYLAWETDPAVARRVLPPMLELPDPEHPFVMVYVVNIREPTFAPWYMEGGIYLVCRHAKTTGVYFLNLQVSGPGAPMALCSGRELSGLPKKLCERIVVERNGDSARAFIEAKGRRIFDAQVEIGAYNHPMMEQLNPDAKPGGQGRGSSFLFEYETNRAPDGQTTFPTMELVNYESTTDYKAWEPARITSITMEPSLDDPWAELAVVNPVGAAYSINSNSVSSVSRIARFKGDKADALIPYLFAGRWDHSTITAGHQR
jgi:acetoacetate decarboxylase